MFFKKELLSYIFIHGVPVTPNIDKLVYLETFTEIDDAIYREKQLKRWKRQWKIELIEQHNPYWNNLFLL